MGGHLQLRRNTALGFSTANPLLWVGEPAFEIDTGVLKIGNGTQRYNLLNPITGSGGGGALADFLGPAVIGRIDPSVGVYQTLDPDDLKTMLDFASSADLSDAVGTVSGDLDDHVGLGTDPADSVHGIFPQTTWRTSFLNGRTSLSMLSSGLPSGFAPGGTLEIKVTDGGLYVRTDAFTWQRIAPLDSFTPYTRHQALAASNAYIGWAVPSGVTELLANTGRNRVPANLYEDDGTTKKYTQARLIVQRIQSGNAGPAGSKLALYYYTGSGLSAAGASSIEVPLNAAGTIIGPWIDIASAVFARELATTSPKFTEFAVMGSGGDGTTTAQLSGVGIDLR